MPSKKAIEARIAFLIHILSQVRLLAAEGVHVRGHKNNKQDNEHEKEIHD